MANPKKKRSRDGCLTCRRRKKKCDESLSPQCHNCEANGLQCTWPGHVLEARKKRAKEGKLYNSKVDPKSFDSSSYPGLQTHHHHNTLGHSTSDSLASLPHPIAENHSLSSNVALRRRVSDTDGISWKTSSLSLLHPAVDRRGSSISQPMPSIAPTPAPHRENYRVEKPKGTQRRENYFLQRIAMQQDCVVEEDAKEDKPDHHSQVNRDLIRSYIANQMDLGEALKKV